MKIFFLVFLILFSLLYGDSVSKNELNSIYMEAVLFVLVFGIMGIVSYIYSTKHAKAYKSKKEDVTQDRVKADRIEELRHLLQKELITEKEFDILKEHYLL